jgi:hypothetical protein
LEFGAGAVKLTLSGLRIVTEAVDEAVRAPLSSVARAEIVCVPGVASAQLY